MPRHVLDASALLALLQAERGHERVLELLPDAVIGAVNLSEVIAKLNEVGVPVTASREALDGLALEVYPFDVELAWRAGLLRSKTRALGLSLGDRACLALAEHLNAAALTADRAWSELDLGVDVELIR
jgi:ribonuclease VapC